VRGAVVRERRAEDLPALVAVLTGQQASTSYPVRWPLPIPVEEFLVRPTEERAWVAEFDGVVVGHVAVTRLDDALRDAFVEACGTDRLTMVAVLFVGSDVVGTGTGRMLHDTAVAWIRASGRTPVLDLLPVHATAGEVYRHLGWRVVGEARAPWLSADHPPLVLMVLD
jgi:GNAT superfamily N-acetyltransferase